jgi:hypothetical protein
MAAERKSSQKEFASRHGGLAQAIRGILVNESAQLRDTVPVPPGFLSLASRGVPLDCRTVDDVSLPRHERRVSPVERRTFVQFLSLRADEKRNE